jgi:hypothetical protein
MKKLASLMALSLAVVLIVLPVACFVNHSPDNPISIHPALRADGNPYPPLPPIPPAALIADGNPYPPLPPPPQPPSASFAALGSSSLTVAAQAGGVS